MDKVTSMSEVRTAKRLEKILDSYRACGEAMLNMSGPIGLIGQAIMTDKLTDSAVVTQLISLRLLQIEDEPYIVGMEFTSGVRKWLSNSFGFEYDPCELVPEPYASVRVFQEEIDVPKVLPFNTAVELTVAHMQSCKPIGIQAAMFPVLDTMALLADDGWRLYEQNFETRKLDGLVLKFGKIGYGHVLVKIFYNILVEDDWELGQKTKAHEERINAEFEE